MYAIPNPFGKLQNHSNCGRTLWNAPSTTESCLSLHENVLYVF